MAGEAAPTRSRHRTIELPADPESTERFGAWLGARLLPGDVVALVGQLGAGKTRLVRGLAQGLGVDEPEAVHSPTYLLVVEHPGAVRLLHADAYLPEKLASFLADGGLEYLFDPGAVAAVEWADRVAQFLPPSTLWVELAMATGGGRTVRLSCERAGDFPFLAEAEKMS